MQAWNTEAIRLVHPELQDERASELVIRSRNVSDKVCSSFAKTVSVYLLWQTDDLALIGKSQCVGSWHLSCLAWITANQFCNTISGVEYTIARLQLLQPMLSLNFDLLSIGHQFFHSYYNFLFDSTFYTNGVRLSVYVSHNPIACQLTYNSQYRITYFWIKSVRDTWSLARFVWHKLASIAGFIRWIFYRHPRSFELYIFKTIAKRPAVVADLDLFNGQLVHRRKQYVIRWFRSILIKMLLLKPENVLFVASFTRQHGRLGIATFNYSLQYSRTNSFTRTVQDTCDRTRQVDFQSHENKVNWLTITYLQDKPVIRFWMTDGKLK